MAKLISADELYKRRGVFADDIGKHGWREAINNLPAAEPERKRGEWRHKSEKLAPLNTVWWFECSVCGHHAFNDMTTDYCPNCGADMRGEI